MDHLMLKQTRSKKDKALLLQEQRVIDKPEKRKLYRFSMIVQNLTFLSFAYTYPPLQNATIYNLFGKHICTPY